MTEEDRKYWELAAWPDDSVCPPLLGDNLISINQEKTLIGGGSKIKIHAGERFFWKQDPDNQDYLILKHFTIEYLVRISKDFAINNFSISTFA